MYIRIYIYIHIYICTYIYTYVYTYVYMYIYICTYVCISSINQRKTEDFQNPWSHTPRDGRPSCSACGVRPQLWRGGSGWSGLGNLTLTVLECWRCRVMWVMWSSCTFAVLFLMVSTICCSGTTWWNPSWFVHLWPVTDSGLRTVITNDMEMENPPL